MKKKYNSGRIPINDVPLENEYIGAYQIQAKRHKTDMYGLKRSKIIPCVIGVGGQGLWFFVVFLFAVLFFFCFFLQNSKQK